LVTVTTDTYREAMKNKLSVVNCETIFNGYSSFLWDKLKVKKILTDKIIISYIGTINFKPGSNRDTKEFFKAFDRLKNKNLIEVRFIGVEDSEELYKLKVKFPEITFLKKVSTIKSLNFMQETHYLLNIGLSVFNKMNKNNSVGNQSSKYLISAKLFDYIRSGKKIISINYPDSYEHQFLKGKNAIMCKNNQDEILNVLNKILKEESNELGKDTGTYAKDSEISKYSREYQNKKYKELVDNLLSVEK
jgi:hypothetical protein